ncbi:hypothetical protein PS862_03929 [Pseudomonas fluorescens]|uniref:Uncharacterized protein n=1 Tax=Pseudomonas fluorescens TaxID=294 RepID=A0A5E6R751_PSEFL|nr:hypothetical protein [Pseudomonas fluorescens]VVM60031.1 hypothetical protein PS639_01230 [Pseudomonas fluorescens]VVP22504.1 hypothetical protein PS862_03929 [Pseudomonas fluorescens]
MHPSFQQRIDELGDLLVHSDAASIDFYWRNRLKSRRGVRFQVVAQKLGLFQVVERYTGKTWTFHNYREALDFAIQLEEKSDRRMAGARGSARSFRVIPGSV